MHPIMQEILRSQRFGGRINAGADNIVWVKVPGKSVIRRRKDVAYQLQLISREQSRNQTRSHPSDLPFKSKCIWHNTRRNAIIAKVAIALSMRDYQVARRLGIDDPIQDGAWRPTVVLVESPVHALALQTFLPWQIDHFVPEFNRMGDVFAGGQADQGRIVTLMYAYHHPVLAGALIRATGGRGSITCGRRKIWIRRDEEFILVDFLDEFDANAWADAQARMVAYVQDAPW
jgi:hypothetical protein